MKQVTVEQLQQTLKRFPIQQAYLFGSHAHGKVTPLSDIDVAVLFAPKVNKTSIEAKLFSALSLKFNTDNIDIIDIATASPLLAHRAVLRGIPIVSESPHQTAMLKTSILHAYEDTRYMRELKQRVFI